jgi:V/A-type H+-transporting ATPase subunit E
MSTNSIKEGLSAIAKEVLQDAGKEVETLMQETLVQAKETLRLAKETADQTYNTIMGDRSEQAKAEKRRIDSVAEVEVRNQLLQTKEALVEMAFEMAVAQLRELAGTEEYHEKLLQLIKEAVHKIKAENLTVRLNAADKAWLTQEELGELSRSLGVNLKIDRENEDCLGGCIVQTLSGDVTYDNSLDARLEQLKPGLRSRISHIFFGEA